MTELIKAIALDNESPALAVLINFCNGAQNIELVKTFTNTDKALEYLQKFRVDLIFLDIDMPSISGLEFRKLIPEKIMIVFTTAFSEYAIDGFNLNAIDYLLKPFTKQRFFQTLEKATTQYQALNQRKLREESVKNDFIMIKSQYSLVKVFHLNIIMIKALDDYIKVHVEDQQPIITRITMKSLSDRLPQANFLRVHKSYIVNLNKIESVRKKMIYIGQKKIPVGGVYEEVFRKAFES